MLSMAEEQSELWKEKDFEVGREHDIENNKVASTGPVVLLLWC